MQDNEWQALLARRYQVSGNPDPAFVDSVMAMIDQQEDLPPSLPRRRVLGAAVLAGLLALVLSLTQFESAVLDIERFDDIQAFLSALLASALASPSWHWMVLGTGLFWYTVAEG